MSHAHNNGVVAGHFRETETYKVNRLGGMEDWLLFYTLEGEGYCQTPGVEKRLRAGELVLLRKDVPHTYGTAKGQSWHFMWSHFRRLPETSLLPAEDVLICRLPVGSLQRRVLRGFKTLLLDFRTQGALWQELCNNQLSGLLLLMAEQLADRLDPRVSHTIRLLSAQMKEPVQIEELAARVGLSASRLSHLFKAETGRSIIDTLNNMRVEQAVLLMKHAGRTATEAAYDVGFHSYNHFAALFRRQYGVSPTAIKREQ
ncbi:AraC family transcriptional regulator of arabinose operon [Paenibacillus phyllosphaerae]|uniref:AraC family transcriptional regulator of arabinose operon n=1 Tax=Paenibacillus phyllosphaerae TaxID=274593 RepID=A0A7W5FNG3_9BACL|nr:AraC family transcriptional regulator [Paenibacillus phyllosphaerae]MBB3111102.1 AraC family transcriptional regulator of arabinose operon [Paenibacillus phyllosphaerae]